MLKDGELWVKSPGSTLLCLYALKKKPHILQTFAYNIARGDSSVFQAPGSASLDFQNQINSHSVNSPLYPSGYTKFHQVCCEKVSDKNVSDLSIMKEHQHALQRRSAITYNILCLKDLLVGSSLSSLEEHIFHCLVYKTIWIS